jgi:hypothetical protein
MQLPKLQIYTPLGVFFYGSLFVQFLRNHCTGVVLFGLFCDGKEPRNELVTFLSAQCPTLKAFTNNMTVTHAVMDEVLK